MNFFKTKNLNFLLYAGMGFLCSQAPARAESVQKISIDVRNERLVDVFKQIKEQSNVSYLFDGKFTPIAKSITLKANSMELRELLPLIFQNQPFGYDYDKGVIVVREKTKDSQTRSSLTHIQEFVSGFVVNETGEALGGATVQLADGSKTVMTDAKGYFNLAISAETVSVRISYTGYETKTVILKQQEAPRIILNARQNILDETIVVGYGVQKKALVTSAVGSLKVDDSNMRQVASPTRLLEGRIAGVNVSMGSGNLASGERISIRGTSSISAGNNPLYVVDGVPINTSDMSLFSFGENYSPLAAFNHADIESIEILKDAASAAIYGSRASNGVVLITTKSGKAGRNDVRVNITTGFSEFANRNKIKLTSSQQYVNSYNAGVDNYNKQFGLAVGQSDYKIRISNPYEGLPDTDWLGLIVQKGYFQNYDASFSGGNTKTNYYFGLGLTDQSGVIKNNAIRKYNLNSKISHKFSDWLEIGANNMGNFIKNNQVP